MVNPRNGGRRNVRRQTLQRENVRSGNARRGNPKMAVFISLGCLLLSCGALIFVTAVFVPMTNQSIYTQAHGLSRSGVVTGVHNSDGRDPASEVYVRLAEPVDGQTTTTAHVRPVTSLKPGATVTVLVDPQVPGYAEFPGHQYLFKSSDQVAVATLLASVAFFTFVTTRWGGIWRRERRRARMS